MYENSENSINYAELVRESMQEIIKKTLLIATEKGVGAHYFYITFATKAKNVKISDKLLAKHPKEMTIVIQHQFENLKVYREGFFISLSFSGIWEDLFIPFSAIKIFNDPSENFNLKISQENHDYDELLDEDEAILNEIELNIGLNEEKYSPSSCDERNEKKLTASDEEGERTWQEQLSEKDNKRETNGHKALEDAIVSDAHNKEIDVYAPSDQDKYKAFGSKAMRRREKYQAQESSDELPSYFGGNYRASLVGGGVTDSEKIRGAEESHDDKVIDIASLRRQKKN